MGYKEDLLRAKDHANKVKEKQNIEAVKHFYDKPKKKLTFGKLMLLFLIINCSVIEVFSMIAMWHFSDLSPLGGLIAAICTETVGLVSYMIKSSVENRGPDGGITYALAMREQDRIDNNNSEEAVG